MRALLLVSAVLALAACNRQQPQPTNEAAPASEQGQIKGVDRTHTGKPLPDVKVLDPAGKQTSLRSLQHGRFLLVNLWASWCAPCVKELPTLDRLAQSGKIQVLAVSQDDGPHPSVVAFLRAHKIVTLKPYQDAKMGLSGALGPDTVLPTSILIDGNGKEVWRYVGDLDWTSPEAAKLLAEAGASKPS